VIVAFVGALAAGLSAGATAIAAMRIRRYRTTDHNVVDQAALDAFDLLAFAGTHGAGSAANSAAAYKRFVATQLFQIAQANRAINNEKAELVNLGQARARMFLLGLFLVGTGIAIAAWLRPT
jgi:hypothetical protein